MAAILSWIEGNWFSLLQGAGIVFGLLFTAVSIRRETRTRKASDLLALGQQHRDLWNEVHRRPELGRVLDPNADLVGCPVTSAEENFLLVAIVHFNTGWHLASRGSFLQLSVLAEDAGWFFDLPIPRTVWQRTKRAREPGFVRFVESCMRQDRRRESEAALA